MLHDLNRDLVAIESHAQANRQVLFLLELLEISDIVVEAATEGERLIV